MAVRELCRACKSVYGDNLVTVAVFGSVGRGTPSTVSDIDLLVISRNLPSGRINRVEQFSAVEGMVSLLLHSLREKGIYTSLSPVLKTPAEVQAGSLLFLDMVNDAVILYDRDNFFNNFLEAFSSRLQKLGARKIYMRGRWHWLLKPDYRQGEVFEI
ncbi:MAG: nucleotidyltransferase domain-containing protein [Bacillota bacterium]